MLLHIRESLKSTGRLVLIEKTSPLIAQDQEEQRGEDGLKAQLAEDDLRKAGFHIAELRDPFVTDGPQPMAVIGGVPGDRMRNRARASREGPARFVRRYVARSS